MALNLSSRFANDTDFNFIIEGKYSIYEIEGVQDQMEPFKNEEIELTKKGITGKCILIAEYNNGNFCIIIID